MASHPHHSFRALHVECSHARGIKALSPSLLAPLPKKRRNKSVKEKLAVQDLKLQLHDVQVIPGHIAVTFQGGSVLCVFDSVDDVSGNWTDRDQEKLNFFVRSSSDVYFPSVLALQTTDSVIVAMQFFTLTLDDGAQVIRLMVFQRNGTFLIWQWTPLSVSKPPKPSKKKIQPKHNIWTYVSRGVLPSIATQTASKPSIIPERAVQQATVDLASLSVIWIEDIIVASGRTKSALLCCKIEQLCDPQLVDFLHTSPCTAIRYRFYKHDSKKAATATANEKEEKKEPAVEMLRAGHGLFLVLNRLDRIYYTPFHGNDIIKVRLPPDMKTSDNMEAVFAIHPLNKQLVAVDSQGRVFVYNETVCANPVNAQSTKYVDVGQTAPCVVDVILQCTLMQSSSYADIKHNTFQGYHRQLLLFGNMLGMVTPSHDNSSSGLHTMDVFTLVGGVKVDSLTLDTDGKPLLGKFYAESGYGGTGVGLFTETDTFVLCIDHVSKSLAVLASPSPHDIDPATVSSPSSRREKKGGETKKVRSPIAAVTTTTTVDDKKATVLEFLASLSPELQQAIYDRKRQEGQSSLIPGLGFPAALDLVAELAEPWGESLQQWQLKAAVQRLMGRETARQQSHLAPSTMISAIPTSFEEPVPLGGRHGDHDDTVDDGLINEEEESVASLSAEMQQKAWEYAMIRALQNPAMALALLDKPQHDDQMIDILSSFIADMKGHVTNAKDHKDMFVHFTPLSLDMRDVLRRYLELLMEVQRGKNQGFDGRQVTNAEIPQMPDLNTQINTCVELLLTQSPGARSLDSLARFQGLTVVQYLLQFVGLGALSSALTLKEVLALNPAHFLFTSPDSRLALTTSLPFFESMVLLLDAEQPELVMAFVLVLSILDPKRAHSFTPTNNNVSIEQYLYSKQFFEQHTDEGQPVQVRALVVHRGHNMIFFQRALQCLCPMLPYDPLETAHKKLEMNASTISSKEEKTMEFTFAMYMTRRREQVNARCGLYVAAGQLCSGIQARFEECVSLCGMVTDSLDEKAQLQLKAHMDEHQEAALTLIARYHKFVEETSETQSDVARTNHQNTLSELYRHALSFWLIHVPTLCYTFHVPLPTALDVRVSSLRPKAFTTSHFLALIKLLNAQVASLDVPVEQKSDKTEENYDWWPLNTSNTRSHTVNMQQVRTVLLELSN